jgi:hypothetical protein
MVCLLAVLPLSGQIVIDWDEIPHEINTRWTKNIKDTAVVNLGSSGGPQNWDFTSQPMGNDSCVNFIVPISQTPWYDSFPNANLVYGSSEGLDTAYLYMQLVSSFLSVLGLAGHEGADTVFMRYNPVDTNGLPEQFGDYRHYRTGWKFYMDPNTYFDYQKKGLEYINAYGTVTIPYGTYDCLRFILWDTLISTMYYNNNPLYTDTATRIGHQFVAEDYSGVVCVFSYEDETYPYFTNAQVLERLTYFAAGVEETRETGIRLFPCYPNPFKDRVNFMYRLEGPAHVSMAIYDAQGKMVREVISGIYGPGAHSFVWDGSDRNGIELPEGVYFYDLRIGAQSHSGKLLLVK